jgi:hypothetical protein
VAEKAKAHPREAAPLFEQGVVSRWYKDNGWTYPVQGPASSGLAAVQQYFEALGLTPAPKVDISAGDALSAAKAAMTDAQKFCERQPGACVFGSQAAIALGHRAQAGAKMLYEFLNEQMGPSETGSVRPARADALVPLPPVRPSQHTLKPGDLAPSWRGPQPPPDDDRPA